MAGLPIELTVTIHTTVGDIPEETIRELRRRLSELGDEPPDPVPR